MPTVLFEFIAIARSMICLMSPYSRRASPTRSTMPIPHLTVRAIRALG
jgi:hypothetical protein